MRRWHFTLGLTGLALAGAWLLPRLQATQTPTAAPPLPPEPIPEIQPLIDPTVDGALTLSVGLDQTAVLANGAVDRYVVVEIGAPADVGQLTRHPLDVTVVLDTSGSMAARGKLDYARQAAETLAASLEPGDTFSLVTFDDRANLVLAPQAVHTMGAVRYALDSVYEHGNTNLYGGLDLGLQTLDGATRRGEDRVGRLVLLSDGNPTVGITSADRIARLAADGGARGLTVSAVGLGVDYNEDLLSLVGDQGGGTYDFVDNPRELSSVFADELRHASSLVAKHTRVDLSLPEGVTPLELIGWEATARSDGWTVWLGDVPAGETRKVVARVRVAPGAAGTFDVARAELTYQDLVSDTSAVELASATALATHDERQLARSYDNKVAAQARRAEGNRFLDLSSRAYSEGDVQTAKKLASRGAEVLSTAAVDFDAPALAEEAAELEAAADDFSTYAPTSSSGRAMVKRNKEASRALVR